MIYHTTCILIILIKYVLANLKLDYLILSLSFLELQMIHSISKYIKLIILRKGKRV